MEHEAKQLAEYLLHQLTTKAPSDRLLVGICGIPASGKSTFADLLALHINLSFGMRPARAVLVGLDGWHLTRAQLDQLPDPKLAHDRRGIYWTFDGPAYLNFIKKLREPIREGVVVKAPSFDHALKDPTPDAVSILPHHRIVIVEGLYTCLDVDEWGQAARLLDERIYLRLDVEEAKQRLVRRHVLTGVTEDLETAHFRADNNDMPNGAFIIDHMFDPTKVIDSVKDPVFSH